MTQVSVGMWRAYPVKITATNLIDDKTDGPESYHVSSPSEVWKLTGVNKT